MVFVDDDDSFYAENGFIGYVPGTVDPGLGLLIATMIFAVLSTAVLPCLVTLGRRYEKRRIAKQELERVDDVNEVVSEKRPEKPEAPILNGDEVPVSQTETPTRGENAPDSYVRGNSNSRSRLASLLDQIIMPPYPDDVSSIVGGSAVVDSRPDRHPLPPQTARSEIAGSEASRSVLSFLTGASGSQHWDTTPLDVGYSGARPHRTRAARRQRRALMDKELRRHDQRSELRADRKIYKAIHLGEVDVVEHPDATEGGMSGTHQLGVKAVQSEVASRVSSHLFHRGGGARGRGRNRGEGSALSGKSRSRGHSPEPSILSKLDDYIISPNDAADANDPGQYILPKAELEGDQGVDLCCGKNAWWRPSMIGGGFDRLVNLAEWDYEYRRIVKLCVPYTITAALDGVVEALVTALVANYLGSEAVAAYTLVQLFVGLASDFLGGIIATEGTLCSHAIGARNCKLAGQYVQVAVLLFTILWIPFMIIWIVFMDDIILLFGFDNAAAKIGQDYAIVLVFHEWLLGFTFAYSSLLNVIGLEKFASIMGVLEGGLAVVGTALLFHFRKESTLQEAGLLHIGVSVVFLLLSVCITICSGRMNKYLDGMVGSLVRDRAVIGHVVRMSLPLSFGYLLEYGEWEILTIFAAYMGPAEVTAWGIVGALWELFETLSNGIGDGGEVRCAYHLGAGNPGMAQISGYKSILLGVVASFFFTSILFILGEDLATWITPDPTLQNLIVGLLPYLGVGNLTLVAGSVAWALVGAQGRYRLATLVSLVCSWFLTLPLAALLTYAFDLNLEGIAAALVIGYSVTCTTLFYIILRSDWERISRHLVEINAEDDSSESSVDEPAEGNGEKLHDSGQKVDIVDKPLETDLAT